MQLEISGFSNPHTSLHRIYSSEVHSRTLPCVIPICPVSRSTEGAEESRCQGEQVIYKALNSFSTVQTHNYRTSKGHKLKPLFGFSVIHSLTPDLTYGLIVIFLATASYLQFKYFKIGSSSCTGSQHCEEQLGQVFALEFLANHQSVHVLWVFNFPNSLKDLLSFTHLWAEL